jgi:solute carrier family 25 (mitochondrial carnitine/acylcarnitine transporter), member 20/29
MSSIPRQFDDMIAGAAAGVVGTALGFPLDAIKSRMQVNSSRSIGWILRSIYAEDGVKSFYRGLASPLVALVLLNSMNFTLYSHFRGVLGRDSTFPASHRASTAPSSSSSSASTSSGSGGAPALFPPLDLKVVLAGAAVGPFAAFISTPFEWLKLQMQFNRAQAAAGGAAVQYRNTLHACVSVVREHGPSPLFTGHVVNASREMVFLGTYFGVYEHSKQAVVAMFASLNGGGGGSSMAIPVAGGVAGALGWLVSYPLDCIKGNIQGQPLAATRALQLQLPRRSITSVGLDILRQRGVLGLYSGVSLSLLRAFIVSASRFSCYEAVLWTLRRDQQQQ